MKAIARLREMVYGVADGPLGRHNPFYAMSAVSMMVGCYLLSGSMPMKAGGLPMLLGLLGIVQVYELMLVGLGLWLVLKRGLARDGRLLLVVETMFLSDATLLVSEAASHRRWGLVVAIGAVALAACKIGWVMTAMKVRVSRWHVAFIAVALAVLVTMPVDMARRAQGGEVGAWWMYAWWWIIGAVMMAHGAAAWWIARGKERVLSGKPTVAAVWPGVKWATVLVVYGSLVLHGVGVGWVHHVAFQWPYLSPVVLGLAVAWDRLSPGRGRWVGGVRRGQLTLPMLAVALSVGESQDLAWVITWELTPLRLSLIGAAGVYAVMLARDRAMMLAVTSACAMGAAVLGPTLKVMVERVAWAADATMEAIARLVPQTTAAWGGVAVGLAFVLLLSGAALSAINSRSHET